MVSIVVRPELDGRGHKAGGRLQIADRRWSVTLRYRGAATARCGTRGYRSHKAGRRKGRDGLGLYACLPDYVRVPQACSIGRRGGRAHTR